MYLKKLEKLNKIIFKLLICSTILSCGVKYDIKKNQKNTSKVFEREFKANANSFEMSMDESNFSYVFSKIDTKKTIWYKLLKGKIVEKREIFSSDVNYRMLNNLKSMDLNCKENEDWDYVLYYKIGDSISMTKYLNLRCLDSIKNDDTFLIYLNSVISKGKPIIMKK